MRMPRPRHRRYAKHGKPQSVTTGVLKAFLILWLVSALTGIAIALLIAFASR